MSKPAVTLQPASPLSPLISPPPQHLACLQPVIILALIVLVSNCDGFENRVLNAVSLGGNGRSLASTPKEHVHRQLASGL